jgi:hypothetical protein
MHDVQQVDDQRFERQHPALQFRFFRHSKLSLVCLDPTTVEAPAGASSSVPRAGGAQSPGSC